MSQALSEGFLVFSGQRLRPHRVQLLSKLILLSVRHHWGV